jgi:REP element-mobilizing transposase RayT
MKKRDYKNFTCGSIVHVYNRGNNKETIFYDEEDYRSFLFRTGLALGFEARELNENPLTSVPYSRIRITDSKRGNFKLHAFCLIKNHFHFLIEQCSEIPLSKLISKICTSYAMYLNRKYGRVGHVFQDKFKTVLIETQPQFMWTSAYIHNNPVKDGYANRPSLYKWSSFQDYISDRNLPFIYKDMLNSVVKNDLEKETLELMSRTVLDMDN